MIIRAFHSDIYEHIEKDNCQAIIVWGRKGFTSIFSTWGQFAERHRNSIEFYHQARSPWKENHSKPLSVSLDGRKKYFYFIRNENDDDTVSDTRFVLQLKSGFEQLMALGVSHVAINGSVPPGIKSVRQFNNDTETQNEIRIQNEMLNSDRVNLIMDFLFNLHIRHKNNMTIDLVSLSDVFIKNVPRKIIYE